MKPFHTIAVLHKDILEGRLTMDVFAADLWEVFNNRGSDEYRDAEIFFKKTYLTQGLTNLLNIIEKRLKGNSGDPVIQIQTPFGGGKTHALIALYHKAKEWQAKPVVISGTALDANVTLWGLIEKQLTGKIEKLSGKTAPGKEAIRNLLSKHQPLLILMDEVLEYVTKAAGVRVEASTLAAQTIAFMQELTETAGNLQNVCVVVTLPSSIIEHYDESAEKFYSQLQKVTGRVEKIYTPVEEHEIAKVIRRRLFSEIKEDEVRKVISKFIEYIEKEGILPAGMQPSEYRDRFIASYPFMPEVLDVLYHRWGSFPNFQRTRGVLRILSLVIASLKNDTKPFISLADFNLSNEELRQEFIKQIGAEFNSVLAQDITDADAGAKKIDGMLGDAYQGLKLGSRAATTIFLYSFSGGQEHGATLGEIKRCATTIENPSSVVSEAVEQLKGKLFYLQTTGDKYYFANQPNLNRILLTKMENIKDEEVSEYELNLLRQNFKGDKFKVFFWEVNPNNIVDSEDLKLVVLKKEDNQLIENIIKNKGASPRVNQNTLFFLFPLESERIGFTNTIKKKIAFSQIENDRMLNLTEDQRQDVKKEQKKIDEDLKQAVRRLYRTVAIPDKSGVKTNDLGIPTFGEQKAIDHEVYDKLRSEGEILEKIVPLVIKEKYLTGKEYIYTKQLYEASLRTPGEARFANRTVLEQGIVEGIVRGIFGVGELENNQPICRYFKDQPSIAFSSNEVLISEHICSEQRTKYSEAEGKESVSVVSEPTPVVVKTTTTDTATFTEQELRNSLSCRFIIPKGKVSSILGILNYLQSKFNKLEIKLIATEGNISNEEIEEKIKEAFLQMGIEIKFEE